MPEAFSSIADMRVVIDSSADKLEAGLTAAQNLVKRFASEGSENLALFDKATGAVAGGIEAIATKANLVLTAIAMVKQVIDSVGTIANTFAEQTDTAEELTDVKESAMELQGAILTGLKVSFDNVKESVMQTAASILGFDANAHQASVTSSDVAAEALRKLGDAFDYVRQHIEDYLPESSRSLSTLETDIKNAKDAMQQLQDQLAALEGMNAGIGGAVDQSSIDKLKEEIAAMQTQIFVLSQMAGGEKIVADAKADRAVEGTKAIQALKAETEAMELNVETMKMSTAESQIYRAEKKARDALDEEDGDPDAADRVLQKYVDRMHAAADAQQQFTDAKKHDSDVTSYLERLNQETDALRDRVAVLGMASAAAAAYMTQARNQRSLDALGNLSPEQLEKANGLLEEQTKLNLQLTAAEDQRKVQQDAQRQDRTAQNAINSLERDVSNEQLRATTIGQTTAATQAQAAEERALLAIRQSGREATPEEIAQIQALGAARQAATEQIQEQQLELRNLQDLGNAVTSNLDSAFRRWASGSEVTVQEMAASILADLAEIEFKAAVLNPLANFLTGTQGGGGGILGQLFGIGGGSSSLPSAASWAAGTSVIPAFADGGDFTPGPMMVGERGPELLWPTFPGKVIPNHALPNAGSGSGGPPVINMPVTINAQGAYPESIADIKAALAETQASIPQVSLQTYQQAKDRGIA